MESERSYLQNAALDMPVGRTATIDNSAAIVTFLRTIQQHHVQLSALADQKASLLIGTAFVVLTILFSQFNEGTIQPPMIVLGAFTLVSTILAVIAVSPSRGVPNLQHNQMNLLFFGFFADIPYDEYLGYMRTEVIGNMDQVYEAMMKDIYQMGGVLKHKKYAYLAYSYRVFLAGILATGLATLLNVFF